MNRLIGFMTFAAMLAANAALLVRDIAPQWWLGQPPPPPHQELIPGQEFASQTGIFNGEGRRVGTSWTVRNRTPDLLTIRTTTILLLDALAIATDVSRIRVDTELTFVSASQLDSLSVRVRGLGIPLKLNGEFVPPSDLPCEWQIADRRGSFVLPASATRALGDAVHPFQSMQGLTVGQSWTVEMMNPLAAATSQTGLESITVSQVARVTREEFIEHDGLGVRAKVVEMDGARAWVAPTGRVLRQEVDAPLVGRIVLLDEPYDDDARRRFLQATAADP